MIGKKWRAYVYAFSAGQVILLMRRKVVLFLLEERCGTAQGLALSAGSKARYPQPLACTNHIEHTNQSPAVVNLGAALGETCPRRISLKIPQQ